MKTKKKNRFFTFCFSLLPGAGEMYMGFMRAGLSLMLLFIFTIAAPIFLRIDELAVFAVVVWFYSFFHANHLAGLNDEEFAEVKDEYLYGLDTLSGGKDFVTKYQKWVAVALIFVGALLMWNTVMDMLRGILPSEIYHTVYKIGYYIPRVFAAVLIIVAGVKMIGGRKHQLAQLSEKEADRKFPDEEKEKSQEDFRN